VLAPVVADDGDREILTARLRARLSPTVVATNQVDRPDERLVQGEGLEVVRRRWVGITDHGSAVAGVVGVQFVGGVLRGRLEAGKVTLPTEVRLAVRQEPDGEPRRESRS
jgi:hypothetical protein